LQRLLQGEAPEDAAGVVSLEAFMPTAATHYWLGNRYMGAYLQNLSYVHPRVLKTSEMHFMRNNIHFEEHLFVV